MCPPLPPRRREGAFLQHETSPHAWTARAGLPYHFFVHTARLLFLIPLIAVFAGCNHTKPASICAPMSAATAVHVSQTGAGQPRHFVIDNRYQVRALVDFANGRRPGFSARRRELPAPTAAATFFSGSQTLLTFGAGDNFFSLTCSGYAGVQEANRVQISEFERLLDAQP